MPLTPEEQRELDQLEYEKLLTEKQAVTAAPRPASARPATAAPAPNGVQKFMADMYDTPLGAFLPPPDPPADPNQPHPIVGLGIRAIPQAAGQMIGTKYGGSMGGRVGAAVGGVAGEALAQAREGNFRPGAMLGAGLVGMMPGSPMAKAGGTKVAMEGAKNAAANVAAKTTETAVDEGRLPSGKEVAVAGLGGIMGTLFAKQFDKGKNAQVLAAELKAKQDATRRETLRLGRDLGYVLPPSVVRPNLANNTINSIGGKAAMAQEAVRHNQPITNAAIREELGLPAEIALDMKAMNTAKLVPVATYKEIGSVSPQAGVALEQFKEASNKANVFRRAYRETRDPDSLAKLKEQEGLANDAFTQLSDEAKKAGKPELVDKFKDARVQLAKIGLVEEAINKGTGDVDATVIGKAFDAGEPLTGKLATIGRFQNAFAQMVKDQASSPPPGVNQLFPVAAGAAGTYMGMSHGPGAGVGTFAGAIAAQQAAPAVARRFALSPGFQNRFVNYAPGPVRPDMAAMLAQFGASAAGRNPPVPAKPAPKPMDKREESEKEAKAEQALQRAKAAVDEAKAKAERAKRDQPPAPAPQKTSFIEGRIYRDPNTGERRRFAKGTFQPV